MSKKKNTSGADLDAALRNYEEAKQAEAAAKATYEHAAKAHHAARGPHPVDAVVYAARLDAEAYYLEAQDRRAESGRTLAALLHAQALASGDADAELVDFQALAADVGTHVEEAERLTAQARVHEQAAVQRIVDARAAYERIVAERAARGLPPPERIPAVQTMMGTHYAPTAVLPLVRAHLDGTAPKRATNAGKIGQLRREAEEVYATIERDRRRREQAAEERRKEAELKEKWRLEDIDRARRDRERDAEENRKQIEERKALAAAGRQRVAGG